MLADDLQRHWTLIFNDYPDVEDIRVIGIDLTQRGIDTGAAKAAKAAKKAAKMSGKMAKPSSEKGHKNESSEDSRSAVRPSVTERPAHWIVC
ncbi:hypothetical protein AYR46_21085 [Sphingobium yanoikuyae]|jgi:hypothetical protein|uniref:Uncharacterized protein n=1 Tax=Sphingobium yanoikuyae TaxID=13690 RepID=A0A084E8V5_SPHYA|nr:hypothetical protein [Sphingobium yanoikuyae]TKV41078.1 hypothetical protein A0U87_22390 [Sphingobium sp. MP9-4]AYO78757.1 hypothetical protein EBF16_18775 [Sphingobium yanoikuyae]KEZ14397.1 hypothetical protein CP98_04870 [Sphingobium yanoikuyae]KZC75386.1 hypothetical protein AYR46_21085 [Sphingobium yanoikuyae]QJR04045.1 hypothetical protein HH800_18675 [Sphingobium yanoikuyae]